MKLSKELKAKRAKYVDYCMNNPCLSHDVDYGTKAQRLDWHRKNTASMTEKELDDELKHIAEMEVK
jgi:hypothetical protein